MMLGLGLSPCMPRGSGVLDPATLGLTGWWRASYAGSPWNGTASAGGSGARNLAEATNPPTVGAAVNGFTPADYVPADSDVLRMTGFTLDTFVNNNAGSMFVVFRPDVASAPVGAGTASEPYEQPAIVSTTAGGHWHLAYNTDGLTAGIFDSAYRIVTVACAAAAWHLACMTVNGSQLRLRVDSGSFSSTAIGNIHAGGMPLTMHTGSNYGETARFDGKILELGFADSVLSDATFDQIKAYVNARYGLAL